MDSLQNRLASLSVEMNRIKEEINLKQGHASSIQSADGGHDSAFLKATTWGGENSISHNIYPQSNFSLSDPFVKDLFESNGNGAQQDDPLDIEQLLPENESAEDWMEFRQFLQCVDDVCHDKPDREELAPPSTELDPQTEADENDFMELVNQAIQTIPKQDVAMKSSYVQYLSSHHISPSRIPSSSRSNPAKPYYTKPSYQIPKLQYLPLDEEGDTIFESAARSIQNKYLCVAEEERSLYPLKDISHCHSNDMSIGSLEYLKRHQLHSVIQPNQRRNHRQSIQEQSSRFLDLEKLRKLKKLK